MWLRHKRFFKLSDLRRLGDLFIDFSFVQEQGFSPLQIAVFQKRSKDLRSMLESSTKDIDCRDRFGRTAIYWAGCIFNAECMELLLQYGGNASTPHTDGMPILHLLAYRQPTVKEQRLCESWDRCLRLLTQYAQRRQVNEDRYVDERNARGRTALMEACLSNTHRAIAILLNAGDNTLLHNNSGNTALYYAICFNSHECLELLLNAGTSMKALDLEQLQKVMECLDYVEDRTIQPLINTDLEIGNTSTWEWKSLETIAYMRLAESRDLGLRTVRLWREFIEGIMKRAGYQPRQAWEENMNLLEEDREYDSNSCLSSSDVLEEESDEKSDEEEVEFQDAVEYHVA